MSTFPDVCRPARQLLFGMVLGLSGLSQIASALDPDRDVTQYVRDSWSVEDGFPSGPVYAISQTRDGYLWAGTEKGLVRFDGERFRLMPSQSPAVPVRPVLGLTTANDGSLWVRLRRPTLLRFKGGSFENAMASLGRPKSTVVQAVRAQDGALLLWVLDGEGSAVVHSGGSLQTLSAPKFVSRSPVLAMAQLPNGEIWIGTRDAGLFRLNGNQSSPVRDGLPDSKINCMIPAADGKLWVGTDSGLVRWNRTHLTQAGVPRILRSTRILSLALDRDKNLWAGTNSKGLVRVDQQGAASFDETDDAPEAVTAVFEDREGNIWAGRESGLERIRDSAFVTYGKRQGVSSAGPVYADSHGRIWTAPTEGGLMWFADSRQGRFTGAGLENDVIYSITGGKDGLWLGRQRGGLTNLRPSGTTFRAVTWTHKHGLPQNSICTVYQSRSGAVWAGTLSEGVTKLENGKLTTYTTADGLASNAIASIVETSDGTMWFGTPYGLSAFSGNRWHTYTIQDGLPAANVNCLFTDSNDVLWAGTSAGLAARIHNRFQSPSDVLREGILGIAEDRSGSLWIATPGRVLKMSRGEGLRNSWILREYGAPDGLAAVEGVRRDRSVVADARGRIWFSLHQGLSVVDPARATGTSAPAIADIHSLSADGQTVELQSPVRIAPGLQRIRLGYSGLSLSVPERVRFRYRLEGFEQKWNESVSTREAVYTNLDPGFYKFHVMASNPEGVWNGAEAAIGFEVQPALWQTLWFRFVMALAAAALIAALYRMRFHQVARRLKLLYDERLDERNRIAQELHDTLLQGFLSASVQLHVAADQLPAGSEGQQRLSGILHLMARVTDEGQQAVQGLRSPEDPSFDLTKAFSQVQQELAPEGVSCKAIVNGEARPLHPMIRDEVYRIGREALVNAFRHSGAGVIETEIVYSPGQLRLFIRDNGRGMDAHVVKSGREGHWGLPGMRERAEKIGGRLHVWSSARKGTEVELFVPGQVAFQSNTGGRFRFRRTPRLPSRDPGLPGLDVPDRERQP